MKNIRLLYINLILGTILMACEYNVENEDVKVDDQCEAEVSYSNTLSPLINVNCMPCHNGDGSYPLAPDLRTYGAVESLAGLIKEVTQSRRMPKNGNLTNAEISAIKCWVDQGAMNN
ncbi:cytochrome c [Flavobacteriaceae bacterium F89]|uniref:Cytochrome c n=1 Tax=Cerina litoralis TaxID=2874477 RepID=A0AAE3EXC6_9FLAO|nr:cytochrome c [Cerina litoralis]MCG2462860.1 cytochrome c [Cerina litoralis]